MMAAPHNVGGIIATTANVHLMATLRNGKILDPGLNMFKSGTWNRRSRNRDGMA